MKEVVKWMVIITAKNIAMREMDEEFDITIKPADLIPENFNSVEAISKLVEKLMED